jgi:hypothetical protein
MLAEHHIFSLNPNLPFTLMDRLLTAVEAILEDEGAARVWVDTAVVSKISVMAELPSPQLVVDQLARSTG